VLLVIVFSTVMIYRVCPRYGRKNPLIYISICSTVGSVSIMAVKGVGIAVKLTFAGYNQFTHPSTYVFILVTVVCILTQMNYFNKALSQFNTNMYAGFFRLPFTSLLTFLVSTRCTTLPSPPAPSSHPSSSSEASTPATLSIRSRSCAVSSQSLPVSTSSTSRAKILKATITCN
jgi:hypothetical protein